LQVFCLSTLSSCGCNSKFWTIPFDTSLFHYILCFDSFQISCKMFGQMEPDLGFVRFDQNRSIRSWFEQADQLSAPSGDLHCKIVTHASRFFIMGVWIQQFDCLGLWKTAFVNWFALWSTFHTAKDQENLTYEFWTRSISSANKLNSVNQIS
jgi:hypothetical protein